MKRSILALLPVLLVAATGLAHAAATPVGVWRTVDDDGKTETGRVRITERNGVLTGVIEKITDPAKQQDICSKCEDDRKGKPVLGIEVIRNVRVDEDDDTIWTGGEILDAPKGTLYRTRLKPSADGKELQVRGYLGPLYRTQTWYRVD